MFAPKEKPKTQYVLAFVLMIQYAGKGHQSNKITTGSLFQGTFEIGWQPHVHNAHLLSLSSKPDTDMASGFHVIGYVV